MYTVRRLVSGIIFGGLLTCSTGHAEPAPSVSGATIELSVTQQHYLFDLVQYLYRWFMDENDVERGPKPDRNIHFWLREIHYERDAGDASRWIQVYLPDFEIDVQLKNSNYHSEELAITVSNDCFKITQVARVPLSEINEATYAKTAYPYSEMRAYLFQMRTNAVYPDGVMLNEMKQATRGHLSKEPEYIRKGHPAAQIIHLAPLSPVANEAWVFWESGRMLLRFASDLDLTNPGLWDLGQLTVDTYDVDEQVVVSLDEVPGSNAYMTRDQVGRALYNCIILGKRIELKPRQ
ncbi:MAG: hypothetical protein EOL87_16690 [Spartobacteria bacterium]|nr:hypothetical protein [Spartobacteria bacterium]